MRKRKDPTEKQYWEQPSMFALFHRSLLLTVSILSFTLPTICSASPKNSAKKPKLAVLIVFDQMRADYLTKWQKHFDKEGLGRILNEGTWFQNCHYPFANTMTAAGHSAIATGCSPDKSGVVANSWYDRKLGKEINAVRTSRYPLVPSLGKSKSGASAERLKQPTIGQALMEQTKGKAKVVSLSIKDRAAIMLAGLRSLLVAWFDGRNGIFVTSTFFRTSLPRWMTEFNKSGKADEWFGKDWRRLRSDLDYEKIVGPDDFAFEGTGYNQGQMFPHPTTGGAKKPGTEYYAALANSPFGNELVLELAKQAITSEKLGQDDVPDLLCLAFSSNDYVGHCWGPYSQEVFDMTLRSDQVIKDLLQFLDAKVGKGQYVVLISADHGVAPIPERRQAQKKKAGRISPFTLTNKALNHLNKKYGKGKNYPWIESASSGMIYLNKGTLKSLKLKQWEVEKSLADWLTKQKGIKAAFGRHQLKGHPGGYHLLQEKVRNSFYPDASGDVMVVPEPYYFFSPPILARNTGPYTTTHGTPHDYDTHVPLLVYGPGIRQGIRKDLVQPQAAAAIIAHSLGIQPPGGAVVKTPKELFQE